MFLRFTFLGLSTLEKLKITLVFFNLEKYCFPFFQVQHFKRTIRFEIRKIYWDWEKIGKKLEKDSCLIYVQIYIIKLHSINFNRYLSFAFWRRELSPPSSAHFQKREVKQLLLVLLKFHRRRRYALCRGAGMYKILGGASFVVVVIFQPPWLE